MALITKQEVPTEVLGFAQGWMYGFMEYGKQNHFEEYDEWHGCGDWDLNLTVNEHSVVKILAYEYKNGVLHTNNWATLCVQLTTSVL